MKNIISCPYCKIPAKEGDYYMHGHGWGRYVVQVFRKDTDQYVDNCIKNNIKVDEKRLFKIIGYPFKKKKGYSFLDNSQYNYKCKGCKKYYSIIYQYYNKKNIPFSIKSKISECKLVKK